MDNKDLKEYALVCECAEESAKLGILLDFLKHAGTHFYSLKAKKEEVTLEDLELIQVKLKKLAILTDNFQASA